MNYPLSPVEQYLANITIEQRCGKASKIWDENLLKSMDEKTNDKIALPIRTPETQSVDDFDAGLTEVASHFRKIGYAGTAGFVLRAKFELQRKYLVPSPMLKDLRKALSDVRQYVMFGGGVQDPQHFNEVCTNMERILKDTEEIANAHLP